MSERALDKESGVDRLPLAEARLQRDLDDHLRALDEWADWRRENEQMAVAVETHLGESEVPDNRPGPERLRGYSKPGLNEYAT
jgi:hypothetical protein